ncbi:hypothetical protein AVEN_203873-1 [Araneus ventricosus]|uniref:Uncharacterized protein n=1 Tax=Araneus ventricosus TaxID=182803 RepID=A0A4Y2I9S2_ARAVE|nr:hypothetical protein AVEN_203873-1 [Araneus ventricosus]
MLYPYSILSNYRRQKLDVSSVYLYQRPVLKQHEGYLGMDLVILNSGQMTRTTPELPPLSPNFLTTPVRGRLSPECDLTWNGCIIGWNKQVQLYYSERFES